MVSFLLKTIVALQVVSSATARFSYPAALEELADPNHRMLKGGCHTCDCFTCDSVTDNGDDTITVKVGHCKGGSISWMCCVGYDGSEGNCNLDSCSGSQEGAKCNGVTPEEGLQVRVPKGTEFITVNTHDGKTAGDADMQNQVCGGNGNQGGSCRGSGTAHCLMEFDLQKDCGFSAPASEEAVPVPVPVPEPVPASEEKEKVITPEILPVKPAVIVEEKETTPVITKVKQDGSKQELPGMNLWEWAVSETPWPDCDTPGQNERFSGAPLRSKKTGECVRINICHGNAGFGWNRITVDRSSLGLPSAAGASGHANQKHNEPGMKRANYFPMTTSVPNPMGAGINGFLDGNCGYVASDSSEEGFGQPDPSDSGEGVPAPQPPAPDAPSPDDKTTPKAFTKGDPHFKTFGGELYDYHGECDLVLLHNPEFKEGLGMDIHIRTKIENFWSSVESAVIKVGEDTMEIKADPTSDDWIWFNGKLPANDVVEGEWHKHQVGGFLVRYKESGPNTREVNLYLGTVKEVIVMKTFKSFVRVDIDWEGSVNYENSVGLLGAKAHQGQRLGRDGTFIENANAFGQEWQVQPEVDGSLFHSYEGAVVGKQCVMPPTYHEGDSMNVSSLRGRRLGASALDTATAEKACNHLVDAEEIKACVYDVIATQDLSMASTW